MNALLKKLIAYLPTNLGALLGILQAVVKFVKEIATLALDLIAPLIPGDGDDKAIQAVRDFCNMIDEWIEKIKVFLLGLGVN